MTPEQQTEAQAAAFRQLVKHLDENKDVQNIDLMILADFCRNCLSKWYMAGAKEQGVDMDYDAGFLSNSFVGTVRKYPYWHSVKTQHFLATALSSL